MSGITIAAKAGTRTPAGLLALALGGFGIGLTEFVVSGLLPDIAQQMHVGEAAASWVISAYALSVAVGAFAVTIATARLPRRTVLLLLVGFFIAGNLICAVAPTYSMLLTGRVIAALCHGAFFGTGSVVAAALVAPERRSRAIALMFTGLTIANVLGVPVGTLIGDRYGWRATFWIITAVGVLIEFGILGLVPRDAGGTGRLHLGTEARALRSGQVWTSLLVTVFGFGGMFGAISLIAYTLTTVTGFGGGAVPWLLVLFGVGLLAGNWMGGRAADRARDTALLVSLAALAAVMFALALTAGSKPAVIALLPLMGAFGFAIAPAVQTRVLDHAPGAATLASSANIAAFNVGNALGAWAGGTAVGAGLGGAAPLGVGAVMAVIALGLMGVAVRRSRRPRPVEAAPSR